MSEEGPHILIVDDERGIRRILRTSLSAHKYHISEATTGQEALLAAAQYHPDVIILDLGLPDMDGVEVIKQLREWTQTPIVILSVREHEDDKIIALDAGADDYLTKPFSTGELMARLRAALRRVPTVEENAVFNTGELEVDLARRMVKVRGTEVQLTPTEYDVLRVLVLHAGKVLTHSQLLRQVRGNTYEQETHLLRVHVSNLRHKLEEDPNRPEYILTEPGVGYRLHADH
jgi:two-component system, OmpR family, KDP operon response regulator KdpE